MKCSELISALLQITMDTDETTERVNAPTVPSWKRSPSPIFLSYAPKPEKPNQNKKEAFPISKHQKANQTAHELRQREENIKTAGSAIPRRQNNNFYPPRRRQRNLGRELTELSKRGLRFGRDLDRFNGLGVKRE